MIEKLKSWMLDDTVFYTILVIVVAVTAFFLGRNSMYELSPQAAGVQISQSPAVSAQVPDTPQAAVSVVVSQSGSKYHLPECPGAKQIKESTKIVFASIGQAKAAGYGPAANCEGLD